MALRRVIKIGLIASGVIVAGALVAIGTLPLQPIAKSYAVITNISVSPSRYASNYIVSYQTPDGFVGREVIPTNLLHCRVGDTVSVEKEGISLTLAAGACRKSPESPWVR
jgi:hypothetical protein